MNEDQMRAEFEAFQRNELMTKKNNTEADADFALEFNGKEYVNSPCMQMAWEAWQAALSAKSVLPNQEPLGSEFEKVLYENLDSLYETDVANQPHTNGKER